MADILEFKISSFKGKQLSCDINEEEILADAASNCANDTSNLTKLEDFHDESSTAWITPSPVLCSSNKSKLLHKKSKRTFQTSSAHDDFKDLYHSVPQIKNHFKVEKQIGCGTFSNVYLATVKQLGAESPLFALKHIFSTSHPKRIENEIKCLKDIGGTQHVVGIESCIRHKGEVVIIMPYQRHNSFADLLNKMTLDDVRDYMRQLLMALHHVHQFNVIHRDVKPNNFLFDLETRKSGLVDFGLAQFLPSGISGSKQPRTNAKTTKSHSHNKSATPATDVTKTDVNCPDKQTNSAVGAAKNDATRSPRAKRRCLAEIQPNSVRHRNIRVTELKKPFTKSKSAFEFESKKIPRFGQSCNVENIRSTSTSRDQIKFMSLTSPMPLASRSVSSGKKRSSSVTIADVFPSIRKYSSSKMEKKPTNHRLTTNNDKTCKCFGKLTVCHKCLARPAPNASRAGTAGFRPPEVLMRYTAQTTAVDIWAAGVIFLSLLSGRCPFFRPSDDIDSLSQLILIFGSKKIQDVAKLLGKKLMCSQNFIAHDLRGVVMALRQPVQTEGRTLRSSPKRCKCGEESPLKGISGGFDAVDIPDSAFNLLSRLLDPNPRTRMTALQALYHDFLITDERKTFILPSFKPGKS